MSQETAKPGWKKKLKHEFLVYWTNVLYLTVFLGVFASYKRLILANYSISYGNYGWAFFEALVLGKFIVVIDALRVGRRFEKTPLIYSTFYKAILFTINVLILKLIEILVRGLWKGNGFQGVKDEFFSVGIYEMIANSMVIFCSFVPFFAFKELARIIGRERMYRLFFVKGAAADADAAIKK